MKLPAAGLRMSRACRAAIDSGLLPALVVLGAAAALWDGMLLQQMIVGHRGNDFGRFYHSARAFLMHQDMYMPNAATATGNMGAHLLNLNPPHFHLLILPLSRLAFEQALGAWMAASVFAWVLSLLIVGREIGLRPTPRRVLAIVFAGFGFSASQAFFLTGQLSRLLLLPMTLCWRAARRRQWTTAGLLVGACRMGVLSVAAGGSNPRADDDLPSIRDALARGPACARRHRSPGADSPTPSGLCRANGVGGADPWLGLLLGDPRVVGLSFVLARADRINRPPGRADKTGEPVHVGSSGVSVFRNRQSRPPLN